MIKRNKYLNELINAMWDGNIKVITGLKRCGKSIILSQIRDEISLKSKNIIYLDFEDKRIRKLIPTVVNIFSSTNINDYCRCHCR